MLMVLLYIPLQMTQIDNDLERSTEVNELEWSVDHNPHVSTP